MQALAVEIVLVAAAPPATAVPQLTTLTLPPGALSIQAGIKPSANALSNTRAVATLMLNSTILMDQKMWDSGKLTPLTGDNAVVVLHHAMSVQTWPVL